MITIIIISEQNDANKQTQQLNKQTKAKPNQTYIYIYTFIKPHTQIVIAEGQNFTNKMKTLIIMVWSPHNCS